MWEFNVKADASVFCGLCFCNQSTRFYKYIICKINNIFLRIQSKYCSLYRLFCFFGQFRKNKLYLLSLIFKFHRNIIYRYFLSLILNFKFFCFRIQNKMMISNIRFLQIIGTNRQIVKWYSSLFSGHKFCNKSIFFIQHFTVTCFIFLSIWCINRFFCINFKGYTFCSLLLILEHITAVFFYDFLFAEKFTDRIYCACDAIFHFCKKGIFHILSTHKIFPCFLDCQTAYRFIVLLSNYDNIFSGFFLYFISCFGIHSDRNEIAFCIFISSCLWQLV